jgi:hypothetical protein
MADLTQIQSAESVLIVGSDSSGIEQTPVQSTSAGSLHTNLRNAAGTEIATAANPLRTDPTGTTTQPISGTVAVTQSTSPWVVSPSATTDLIGTDNITSLNDSVTVNTQGRGTIIFTVTGTWVATLTIQGTVDNVNWVSLDGIGRPTNTLLYTLTTNNTVAIECAGFQFIRLISTAFTSGTAVVAYDASDKINNDDPTYGNNGQALATQSQLVSGSDGTNMIPLSVDSSGRLVTSSLTGFGADFAFGDITTAARTRVLVRRTTYTEQTTDAQRRLISSSANDTAAGTGARTVKITYFNSTGAGPFTETVTLNGTTAVNTVATNIRFIEQIEVLTAGSGGANAGTISIQTLAAVTFGSIAIGDNQTFWCHHYIPTGKTCNITGISCGHNGTTVGSGALFTLNAKYLSITNSVETQISDFVRLYGQTSTFARTYTSPIKIIGPARIQTYVTPETSSSTTYRAAFDFFEP